MSSPDFSQPADSSAYQNRILSIDGGGIRGWVSIPILKKLEEELALLYWPNEADVKAKEGFRLCHYFNFVGGTSVGAILAALISTGKSMDEIETIFKKCSTKLFSSSVFGKLRYKYGRGNVETSLKDEFKDVRLGDKSIETLLFLMLRNATTGSNWPLTNNPRAKYNRLDRDNCNLAFPLWKLVRASTAAPTFFPVESIKVSEEPHEFIDGCMSPYNNPAFAMFMHAILPEYRMEMGTGVDRMLIVSVGTGSDEPICQPGEVGEMSILGSAGLTVRTLMHSSSVEQDTLCRVFGDFANQPYTEDTKIDREVEWLSSKTGRFTDPSTKHFTYLRYNPKFSTRLEKQKNLQTLKKEINQLKGELRQTGASKEAIKKTEKSLQRKEQQLKAMKTEPTHEDQFRRVYQVRLFKKQPFAIDAVEALEFYRQAGKEYADSAVLPSHFERFLGPLGLGKQIVDRAGNTVSLPHETQISNKTIPVAPDPAYQRISEIKVNEKPTHWRSRSNNALILFLISSAIAIWLGIHGGGAQWVALDADQALGSLWKNPGAQFAGACLLALVSLVSSLGLRWIPRKRLTCIGLGTALLALNFAMVVRSTDFWTGFIVLTGISMLLLIWFFGWVRALGGVLVTALLVFFFDFWRWDHWLPTGLRGKFSLLVLVSLSAFTGAVVTWVSGWGWPRLIRIDKKNSSSASSPQKDDPQNNLPAAETLKVLDTSTPDPVSPPAGGTFYFPPPPPPTLKKAPPVSIPPIDWCSHIANPPSLIMPTVPTIVEPPTRLLTAPPAPVGLKPLLIPLPNSAISMFFQPIPAGSFRMGSYKDADEQPVHLVTIPAPFFLGTFPVTQEEFAVWTRENLPEHQNRFSGNPRHPAENMSWFEAMGFCQWLNQEATLPPGYFAILPDEARWEYACRAEERNDGSIVSPEYYSGNGAAALDRAGWYAGNSGDSTHPVGAPDKEPNRWGLGDMHGNVWEWCLDLWDEDAYRKNTGVVFEIPEFPLVGTGERGFRVYRGGSWYITAVGCRSAIRVGNPPGYRDGNLGFRVCLVPGSGGGAREQEKLEG